MLNTKRPRGKRADLTADQIVAAAFAVLDAHGFDALTMRAIAARLKVQNPALYWHFEDKQALVDAMAAAIVARAVVDDEETAWDEAVASVAHRFRRALLSHREGARIVASADLAGSALHEGQRRAYAMLERAGFASRDAVVAVVSIYDFTLGATFEEQTDPKVRRGGTAMFDDGLAIFIDGMRFRRRGRRDPGTPRTNARRAKRGSRARGAG